MDFGFSWAALTVPCGLGMYDVSLSVPLLYRTGYIACWRRDLLVRTVATEPATRDMILILCTLCILVCLSSVIVLLVFLGLLPVGSRLHRCRTRLSFHYRTCRYVLDTTLASSYDTIPLKYASDTLP